MRTKVKFRNFQLFAIQVNEISKLLCGVLYSNPNLPIVGQEWDPRTGVYRSHDGHVKVEVSH